MTWYRKDSYDRVMAHKEKYGHWPLEDGVFQWAWEYLLHTGDAIIDQKEEKKARKQAEKIIAQRDAGVKDRIIPNGKYTPVQRLTSKILFIKHYEK